MAVSSASSRFQLTESGARRDREGFAEAVREGLTAAHKFLPCRFLYDQAGSKLFEEICALPEYYVTRAEREILETRAGELAGTFDERITLAELGSGSSVKTCLLIEALLARQGALRYVPVDISRTILEESALGLLESYPALEVHAIAAEYEAGLRHVHAETGTKLVAWLGSNVGNFERDAAAAFLRAVRANLDPEDRLLVGFDLRKDAAILEAAYDDPAGVTARFNLNLLARINRELGGDFDLSHFAHRATWNEDEGRVEMELVSLAAQCIPIAHLDLEIDFADGEPIHTEYSFKYSHAEIEALAEASGLTPRESWQDPQTRFSLNLFAPA